ncbi:proactivator polypeptide-like 1 [Zingiber officinale]|uniref:proactivator polypeptide-like 1 n=1 Tax=Zingiber officinale TaxID=94328 RepID=UPI001C4AC7C2|nr:proactivator polypeptide-like 1 [Zingiber officinale]XP_042425126.1 proactivator polypeptide-like 1 [Zingiber officinale]
MDSRLNFLVLMLVISFACANAKSLASLDVFVVQVDNEIQSESHIVRNEKLCTLCKEFASQALYYLGENVTQTQVTDILHKACSKLHSLEQQCITLVDYYAPLFFLEVSKTSPEEFCDKVNLCDSNAQVSLPKHDNACTLCQDILGEVLSKLQDPDTELEVIEILLKGCNKMENFVQKCKKLVFQYGPLILANAEKLLEKTDLCTSIHACKTSQQVAETILASA